MDFESRKRALIESIRETGDPSTILVLADLLEEHGDELCHLLRACEERALEIDSPSFDTTLDELTDEQCRWFAANCAERLLPVFEAWHPDDDRPHTAIRTLREFVLGRATWSDVERARRAATDAEWYGYCVEDNARLAAWNAASLAAAEAPSRTEEMRWQQAHATKILHLGLIPLTEAERTEYTEE